MITITTKISGKLADELIENNREPSHNTKISIVSVSEGVAEIELNSVTIEGIIKDVYFAGLYAGIARMSKSLNTK